MRKQIFEVDKKGLAELQAGKSKTFIIRELLQNAFDEKATCVELKIEKGITHKYAVITVIDDSLEGFKDLRDAYTLFKPTDKRNNPYQRGRFNFGEKQIIAIAEKVWIKTTKGSVIFDRQGRRHSSGKTEKGSIIEVLIKLTKDEFDECLQYARDILNPHQIHYIVNDEVIKSVTPKHVFQTMLQTEQLIDRIFKRIPRKTSVELYTPKTTAYLYEMGLPVCEINCKYSINVLLKVPLGTDRETVSESYLKTLYAEVLNYTYKELQGVEASQIWVREATRSSRIIPDAVQATIQKRYGDKVVVRNPFDVKANDEALARGYKVVSGNEMDKEEWGKIREFNIIKSSSEVFGLTPGIAENVEPTEDMKQVAIFAKALAVKLLGKDITVEFKKLPNSYACATYGDRVLTFFVNKLPLNFFTSQMIESQIDLLLHELAHEYGHHTEKSYHEALSKMGAKLTTIALNEPKFFSRRYL